LYAIGSGGQIALGALAALNPSRKNIASAITAVKTALKISIQYNLYTGGEIQIMTQEY
jgi:ATP-dependent protease HslVU (ClpYQ) peptidase subunit